MVIVSASVNFPLHHPEVLFWHWLTLVIPGEKWFWSVWYYRTLVRNAMLEAQPSSLLGLIATRSGRNVLQAENLVITSKIKPWLLQNVNRKL